jgi:hypothetical protein
MTSANVQIVSSPTNPDLASLTVVHLNKDDMSQCSYPTADILITDAGMAAVPHQGTAKGRQQGAGRGLLCRCARG